MSLIIEDRGSAPLRPRLRLRDHGETVVDTRDAARLTARERKYGWNGWTPPPQPTIRSSYSLFVETYGACPVASGAWGSDVEHECEHGRLPMDATPACGCWLQEL